MFRIEWTQSALDELAALWTKADSSQRQAITSAAHQIDEELQANPYQHGESRPGGRRVHFVYPLGLVFRWSKMSKPFGWFTSGNSGASMGRSGLDYRRTQKDGQASWQGYNSNALKTGSFIW